MSFFPGLMHSYQRPIAIQCAELAAQRTATAVHQTLNHRVSNLATISATAALLGLFDCVLALTYGFRSVSGPPSWILAMEAGCLGQALLPALLGVVVAVMAFCFYRTINTQLADFDLEMQVAVLGLGNGLTAYLRQLRSANPVQWSALSQRPGSGTSVPVLPIEGPSLQLIPEAHHGVWQLLWPDTKCDSEASSVLDAASTIAFVYGVIACVQQWAGHHWFDGLMLLAFFEMARRNSAKRSPWGLVAVLVYLLAAFGERFSLYGLSDGTLCVLLAPLPLLGSLRAAVSLNSQRSDVRQHLLLAGLLVYVALPGSFVSTRLETYVAWGDAMLPAISQGDSILCHKGIPATLTRGEVLEVDWNDGPATLRLVALPGDSVAVSAGALIVNGAVVHEPYVVRYTDPRGDFPLPTSAYVDELNRLYHNRVFGSGMNRDTVYQVPSGKYFFLNDNRGELFDSRIFGPLERTAILAKPLLVYRLDEAPFHFLHLLNR